MAENRQLTNAKSAKNDEFYTQDAGIEEKINADTFGYNARGEVVSATIAGGSPSPAAAIILPTTSADSFSNLLVAIF